MAKPIRRTRVDATQKEIVEALEQLGCFVYVIGWPCDLLVYRTLDMRWFTMECKVPRNKKGEPKLDKRQKEQTNFIKNTNTPYITSPRDAVNYILGAK